jgi:mannosyltransferase OCH1-like enzyme
MQTWKTNVLPSNWQASQDAIKRYMPSWKYVLMTDEDNLTFVKRYFPDFLHHYLAFPHPIQRADAIRYMWFYVHGGVYMDLDLEIIRPFDELFYTYADMYSVKSIFMDSVYTNAFMASQPRNPIMLECVRLMSLPISSTILPTKHFIVINSTGPNMYTMAIENTKSIHPELIVYDLPQKKIINCDVCGVQTPYTKRKYLEGAYIKNLGGSSWSGADSSVLSSLWCKREGILVIIIIILMVIIIAKKRGRNWNR